MVHSYHCGIVYQHAKYHYYMSVTFSLSLTKCRAHSRTHVLMFEYANYAYANDISGKKLTVLKNYMYTRFAENFM